MGTRHVVPVFAGGLLATALALAGLAARQAAAQPPPPSLDELEEVWRLLTFADLPAGTRASPAPGTVLLPATRLPGAPRTLVLSRVELTPDGFVDLLALTARPGAAMRDVTVFLGRGDGTFELAQVLGPDSWVGSAGAPMSAFVGFAVADFDRDGASDVAVPLLSSEVPLPVVPEVAGIGVALGDGKGRLAASVFTPVRLPGSLVFGPRYPVAGDFDGDGAADLVVAVTVASPVTLEVRTQPFLLLGQGDGSFVPTPVGASTLFANMPSAGDYNGDRHLDFALARTFFDEVAVYLGDGQGGFAVPLEVSTGTGGAAFATSGDLNADGLDDLLVPAWQRPRLVSLLATGAPGVFEPPLVNHAAERTGVAEIVDVTGDGFVDVVTSIVVPVPAALTEPGGAEVFVGLGAGRFLSAGTFETGPGASFLVAADFDGDGRTDVVQSGTIETDLFLLRHAPSDFSVFPGVAFNDDPSFVATLLAGFPIFAEPARVTLGALSLPSVRALGAQVLTPSRIEATFDLRGVIPALYDVAVNPSASGALAVAAAVPGFSVVKLCPAAASPGAGITHGVVVELTAPATVEVCDSESPPRGFLVEGEQCQTPSLPAGRSVIGFLWTVSSTAPLGATIGDEAVLSEGRRVRARGTCSTEVRAGIDPNHKTVAPQGFIAPDERLSYLVEFENIGNAPAHSVAVVDELDPLLDPTTLEVLTPGASFDPETRTLRWLFEGIDLAPGAGGFVAYSIRPLAGLSSGTEIRDAAAVVFDAFAPVVTNATVNVVDADPPSSSVLPLSPIQREPSFVVSWEGTDLAGSGVRRFTVYVSTDGGPPSVLARDTEATSTLFRGQLGHGYAFFSVAEDRVGNVEPFPEQPDARTVTRPVVNTPPVVDAGPDARFFTEPGDLGCDALVRLEGSIADADGDFVAFFWERDGRILGGGIVDATFGAAPVSLEVELGVGLSTLALVASDGVHPAVRDEALVEVVDATRPSVSVALEPAVLWPPNHRLVPVTVRATARDNCDPRPRLELLAVTSSEPDDALGDGRSGPDVVVVGPFDLRLRAERSGTGTGRTYEAVYRATDATGNRGEGQAVAMVPHDRR